jgi:hypothetical protein
VAQIMERERVSPQRRTLIEADERDDPDRSRLPLNPLSPRAPQWPWTPGARNAPTLLPPRGGDIDNPQTVSTNWQAVGLSETGALPPDTDGAVGPSQIIVFCNGRIKSFDKTTGALGSLNTSDATFFNSVRGGIGMSDPNVRYDSTSQRWFLTEINVASSNNRVCIAVSNGPVINASTTFTFFFFQQNLVAPAGNTNQFLDYPSLGVDTNALYIGGNMFSGSFVGTTGFVVQKASVLGAGPIQAAAFRNIASTSVGPYSPRGVDNDNPAATEGYFIGVDTGTFGTLYMRRVSNPGGTPSISGNLLITVPATDLPIATPASGSSPGPDALDDRLFAAQIHLNRATNQRTLWTAHNIQVTNTGVAGSGGRNGSRWYQITNLTTTPSLAQSGTLFDPTTGANPVSYWIPSIAMTGQGLVALSCSSASAVTFIGASTAGRLASDPTGSTESPTTIITGAAAYQQVAGGRQRWGDYSESFVDPVDDQTVWTFQEYANGSNSYGVRAVKLLAPPPATPISASPSVVTQGETNVDVQITGSSSAGSAFYDTAPGFNRLQASLGTGVTINSITFTDGTHITLNITVAAAAAVGSRTVSMTNPDGQNRVSATGLVTIDASTPCPQFTQQPSGASQCAGPSVTLVAAAQGTPTPTLQWRKDTVPLSDGGNISGSLTGTLVINPTTAADTGSYDCVATNTCGSQTSTAAQVTIDSGPQITQQPQSLTVAVGQQAQFTVAADNATSYVWRHDTIFIPGALSPTYTISSVQPGDDGEYDCIVTGPCGQRFSQVATLTIGTACYANCDGSTTQPILTVNDFVCFQARFAAGDSYANCDGSTTEPILTVNDFICFQGQFAAGCP